MPSRNVLKIDIPESYYHIYARRASKEPLFVNDGDYRYFIELFKRYLSEEVILDKTGVGYTKYQNQINLLAFCLMSNHFHLLVYQKDIGYMTKLMRGIMTSYSRYFNLKYKRTGSLFESRYKASRIDTQQYLEHISRYIHLNPRYWQRYEYSSISFYKGSEQTPDWINTNLILGLFKSTEDYIKFLKDNKDHKQMLDEIKYELADT